MTIIPDLSDLVLEQVSMTNEVTITVRAASATAPCPCCGIISKRIQSRYTRSLRDLPASGRPVHLVIHVRRFFCQENKYPLCHHLPWRDPTNDDHGRCGGSHH